MIGLLPLCLVFPDDRSFEDSAVYQLLLCAFVAFELGGTGPWGPLFVEIEGAVRVSAMSNDSDLQYVIPIFEFSVQIQ